MAKLGEGDPRWLVEIRPDGKNVNNWHWAETDILSYAKQVLPTLLDDLILWEQEDVGKCGLTEVKSVTGEATVNIRKGKTIFFYELEVKTAWKGEWKNEKGEGELILPYISEENDDDKHEVQVTCTNSGAGEELKRLILSHGVPIVLKQIEKFLTEMKKEFTLKKAETNGASSSSSSTPSSTPSTTPTVHHTVPTPTSTPQPSSSSSSSTLTPKSSISTKTLKFTQNIHAPKEVLYGLLLDSEKLSNVTQSRVEFNPKVGGAFSMFGGSVVGEFVTLEAPTKIVQKWRNQSWPKDHFSTVTFSISDGKVDLTQTGVPSDDVERTEDGWNRNFWERVRMVFSMGSVGMF